MPVTNDQLMDMLNNISQQNTEIKNQNKEIKLEIEVIKRRLQEELEAANKKLETLESENKILRETLEKAEKNLKKKNFILYGVQEKPQENLLRELLKIAIEILKIDLHQSDVSNIFRIGRKNKTTAARPILIELTTYIKKIEIFKSISYLKGSGLAISDDLLPQEREIRKKLLVYLKEARSKNYLAKIKNNKLIVNGESYTLEELNKDGIRSEGNITGISAVENLEENSDIFLEEQPRENSTNTNRNKRRNAGTPPKRVLKITRSTSK